MLDRRFVNCHAEKCIKCSRTTILLCFVSLAAHFSGEYPGDRQILYTSELDTHVPDMGRNKLMPIYRSMFAAQIPVQSMTHAWYSLQL